jgi:hypothetical protein
MDNSEKTSTESLVKSPANSKPKLIIIITLIALVIVVLIGWKLFTLNHEDNPLENRLELPQKVSIEPSYEVAASNIEETNTILIEPEITISESSKDKHTIISEPQLSELLLPSLDESDEWIQQKISELTWRNELITLIITEDMIRRFVVFTDNFSKGLLAYDHSPFVKPIKRLTVDETQTVGGRKSVWAWDIKSSKRFDVYVDLLRSVNSSTLVNSYFDSKPLIDEAYRELGYEGDFTEVLQDAINRVLDMELPHYPMNLTRTSVMYKFNNPELETLTDSDKLLLRIGKENLLIIKSMLIEIDEKLIAKSSQ